MSEVEKDEAREHRITIEAIVDAETQEAIEDWHYWVARGYEF